MSRFGLILIFIALGWTVNFGQKQIQSGEPEWKEFASEEFKFKAAFPGVPKASVDELDAKSGKIYAHWFIVTLPGRFYGVSVTDYRNLPLMLKEDELKKNYTALIADIVKAKGLKLLGEKDLRLGGQFGHEVVLTNEKEILIQRMFLVRQRLYQVITTMPEAASKDEKTRRGADRFLDSFRFAEIKND
ncbi:MAG TPA: hypothetical protein VF721_00560 [Pyrinomonadaceae bacterium]|jgi:hypothetical protein